MIFINEELSRFNEEANAIKANISSATFTADNGKAIELINSVLFLREEVTAVGAGYSILHSVEDALIIRIKEAGPSSFSPSEQGYITSWLNAAISNGQKATK